jgi:hypothetical protein
MGCLLQSKLQEILSRFEEVDLRDMDYGLFGRTPWDVANYWHIMDDLSECLTPVRHWYDSPSSRPLQ